MPSPISLFAFLFFIVQHLIGKPYHTKLKILFTWPQPQEPSYFALLKEGNFPPSLIAKLPSAALLSIMEVIEGFFLNKKDLLEEKSRS